MRRKKEPTAPPPAALAALVVLVAAAAVVLRRRRAGAGGSSTTTKSGPEPWTCQCGTEFRVSGTGRHTVFWLAEADEGDPVLGSTCPSCDAELPVTL